MGVAEDRWLGLTVITQPSRAGSLPAELAEPLRAVARRQRWIALSSAMLRSFAVFLLVLLVSSLLLGYLPLPRLLRIPAALVAWGAIFYLIFRTSRFAFQRRTLQSAARQIERARPGLEERLTSAVELVVHESNPVFRGSPQLVGHLLRQVREEVAAINPVAIVPNQPVARAGFMLLPLIVAAITLCLNSATSHPLLTGAYAVLVPWAKHLPGRLAAVQVSPGDVVLPQGEMLNLSATIRSHGDVDLAEQGATLIQRLSNGQTISRAMDRASSVEFKASIEDIREDFSYRVSTDAGESDWFAVTVHPRPAIARLDLHYDFPPYSRLAAKDESTLDGAITALVGTRLTVDIHTAAPIVLESSRVVLDQGRRDEEALPLTAVSPSEYRAQFIVHHGGDYRIRLHNTYGLDNNNEPARPIVAQFDQSPTVTILSPTPQVTVRPDDTVPVEYHAADDFAVASVSAFVQADDGPEQTIPLQLPQGDRRAINGTWPIDIQQVVSQLNLKKARRLRYWLKVTDNRDPDPQSAKSAEQVLILDANQPRSYAEQLNEQRKRQLDEAIRKAIERLRQADWRSGNLANFDDRHVLNPDERRDARELRELLVSASRELSSAADAFMNGPFAAVAREAKDVAQRAVADAADNVASAELNADQPPDRRQSAAKAHQQVIDAIRRLEKLQAATEEARRKADGAEELARAAKKQQQAADAMAQQPEDVEQNRAAQQQAIDRLNDAMNKDPALRDPQAQELGQKLGDLTQRIDEEQAQQAKLHESTSQKVQAEQAKPRKRSGPSDNDLAQKQHELANRSKEIREAARQLAEKAAQQRDASLSQRTRAGEKALEQAAAAQEKAADAAAAHDPQRAANEQEQAQRELAKANESLRGNPQLANGDDSKGESAQGAKQSPQSGQQGQNGKQSDGSEGKGEPSAGEDAREAARGAQEAAAAQRQAMRSNPAAARQAANALARAAAAAQRAMQSGQESGKSSGESAPAGQSADAGAASQNQKPSAGNGRGSQGRAGIRGQATGGNNTPPAAVLDLGISPADWAKLPPTVQQDLLNASQQTGPPAYREMIRNYYNRIATMQTERK